jgi:hypothetical protein
LVQVSHVGAEPQRREQVLAKAQATLEKAECEHDGIASCE